MLLRATGGGLAVRETEILSGFLAPMLKRISVDQLETGMYLHRLCGSWMSHPFWRKSFTLSEKRDIQRILDSDIREVWIDTDKGSDVAPGTHVPKAETLSEDGLDEAQEPEDRVPARSGLREELRRAARTCAKSKQAVISMFQETRMGKAIESEGAMEVVEEINASILRNPHALISIARLKQVDDYTYMHSVAVCGLMLALAQQLGLDEDQTREAGLGGLLHDIGKSIVPLEVLNKPGKLTDAEFSIMRSHPEEGYKILSRVPGISESVLDACRHHHEKADGSGYAQRLSREQVSVFAKMSAVCDVYDAITSERPYKHGWDPAEAVHRMAQWSNSHFEQAVFQAFVKTVGIYPPGTLVRLASGRLAVVLEQSGSSLLTPTVKVFFSVKAQARVTPEIVDLARTSSGERIVAHEDPASWDFTDLDLLWRGADAASW